MSALGQPRPHSIVRLSEKRGKGDHQHNVIGRSLFLTTGSPFRLTVDMQTAALKTVYGFDTWKVRSPLRNIGQCWSHVTTPKCAASCWRQHRDRFRMQFMSQPVSPRFRPRGDGAWPPGRAVDGPLLAGPRAADSLSTIPKVDGL